LRLACQKPQELREARHKKQKEDVDATLTVLKRKLRKLKRSAAPTV
jgi:hypothetical protein